MEKLYIMKAKILFLSLFLSLSVVGQNISELYKGLIFRTELNEYGARDLVSGTLGTATATYTTQDKQGNGGTRNVQYNGTSSVSTFTAIAAFGTSDFMVTAKIQVGALGAVRTILGGAANAFDLNISATGYLTAKIMGGSALTASTTLLAASGTYTVSYSRTSTTGTYYVNGVAAGTCTDANNYTVGCTLAGNGTGYFNGSIFMVRAFNWAASVTNYSRPEYPIEWVDRGTTGTELVTNGSFTGSATGWSLGTGWAYGTNNVVAVTASGGLIQTISTITGKYINVKTTATTTNGPLKVQVGGTALDYAISNGTVNTKCLVGDNGNLLFFGTSLSTTIDDISAIQLGCVLDLNAEGLSQSTSGYWYDKTNSLTATNSGTTLVIPPASNLSATFFNGSTSNIAFTGMNGLTGDITISGWINSQTVGENGSGRFIDNSKLVSYLNVGYFFISRDGNTTAAKLTSFTRHNEWYNLCITSTTAGVTNIYINGVLTGTANQAAGTPVSATSLYIGNNSAGTRTCNGSISKINIWDRILDNDQIKLIYDTNF
jgi:hypothetical protein